MSEWKYTTGGIVHSHLRLQWELALVRSMPFWGGKMEGAGLVTSPSTVEETILTRA